MSYSKQWKAHVTVKSAGSPQSSTTVPEEEKLRESFSPRGVVVLIFSLLQQRLDIWHVTERRMLFLQREKTL